MNPYDQETVNIMLSRLIDAEKRFIDNEKFISSYSNLSWWERAFKGKKIIETHKKRILMKYVQ